MSNKNVSFYGYNDGKAITIYNCIRLFIPTVISVVISVAVSVASLCLQNYYLLFIWLAPFFFALAYLLNICLTTSNDKVFLKGLRKKHSFVLDGETLYKDGREIKSKYFKLYKFRNFLFLELKKSYYRIPNDAFVGISREEFLSNIAYNPITHKIQFFTRYKCPCCGYYTLSSYQLYEICPVCFWEDAIIDGPDAHDDCNGLSLNQARENYSRFGACKKGALKFVRKPRDCEKLEECQKLTFAEFKKRVIQVYAKDVPQKLLRKHVLGNNYIWHLFSWELISADKYLSGEDARRAYDSCDKSNALVIDEIADVCCVSITKDYLTAKEIGGMEIYVFAEDFSWVYLNTHEEHIGLGPYFIKK